MPGFGDDGIYVWSITLLGLIVPALMSGLVWFRVHQTKARLGRLEQDQDEI